MTKYTPENPDPALFATFSREEVTHRVKVAEENIHLIARHFGWLVDYSWNTQRLRTAAEGASIEIGAWIDHGGAVTRADPEADGWSLVKEA